MSKIFFFFLLVPLFCWSQDFSDEDYIYLKRHEHMEVSLNNNEFNIVQNVTELGKFNSSKKLFFANESIGYSSFSEITDLEAFTYLPATDKKIEVDYIETKQEIDNMVFYSDTKIKSFTYPAVAKGAETHLNYKRNIKEPRFLGSFNFASYVPTKSAQLSIEFPKNVEIGYVEFNTDSITLDFKIEETASSNIYTWNASNTESYKFEDDSENPLYYIPHIIFYIKNYQHNGKTVGVSGTVDDLYKWYVSLANQTDVSDLSTVFTIADDITKDLTNDTEKAKAIFEWVQDNINYIAFTDAYNGLVPAGAAATCEARYGDCKAMSNLLYEMLNHVNIEAYRTWIGSRDLPYAYSKLPTTSVSNHMITTAIIENDTIFLDATSSQVPFGMPSAFIQDKEALVGIDNDTYKILKVPAPEANKSLTNITSTMRLENDIVKVSEKRALQGYDKERFVSEYMYKKELLSDEEFLNTTLALGNNKTKYTNITKTNLDNNGAPMVLEYDLDIDSYTKNIGDKIYINLNIDRSLSNSDVDLKDRKFSKKIDYKFQRHFTTSFEIPEGYKVSSMPDELSFEDPNYGFKISYDATNSVITQTKTFYINTLSIEKEGLENWNQFIKSLRKAYKKSITLEQI